MPAVSISTKRPGKIKRAAAISRKIPPLPQKTPPYSSCNILPCGFHGKILSPVFL
jgi:hypothetical protein